MTACLFIVSYVRVPTLAQLIHNIGLILSFEFLYFNDFTCRVQFCLYKTEI